MSPYTKLKSININWDAVAVILTLFGCVYFLGAQNSETMTKVENNSAMLKSINTFMVSHSEGKQKIWQEVVALKTAMKYYHSPHK